jgi:hypothetical protein
MFKLKLLAVLALGVAAWYIPRHIIAEADELAAAATGAPPPGTRVPVPNSSEDIRDREARLTSPIVEDDIQPRRNHNVPNPEDPHGPPILVRDDPAERSMLEQACARRTLGLRLGVYLWAVPVLATVMLLLGWLHRPSRDPLAGEVGEIAAPVGTADATDDAHKREMEKLALLIELERLKAGVAKAPEAGKVVAAPKPVPPA